MKRSLQEYVELVVFGLIALLVGTGLLWVVGWVLSLGGIVLKGLAGLLWMLLRFIVPVAIAGGLVYFLVKAAQDKQKPASAAAGAGASSASTGSAGTVAAGAPVVGAGTSGAAPAAQAASTTVGSATSSATQNFAAAGDAAGDAARDVATDVHAAAEDVVDAVEDGVSDGADAVDIMAGEDDEDEAAS